MPAAFHGGINDVLLTGLVVAIADWCRRRGRGSGAAVLLDLEGHGREEVFGDIDLSGTVGWFTSLFPVRLDPGALDVEEAMAGGGALGRALKSIKEQLRALPDNGLGYGVLRYLNPQTASQLAGFAAPQIGFNYLGRFAASAAADWGSAGEAVRLGGGDPAMPLAHCLEVNALTLDDREGARFTATWSWAPALVTEAEVRDLAERWFAALEALVRHAAAPGAGGRTPAICRWWRCRRRRSKGWRARIRRSRTSCRWRRCRRGCCSMRFMTRRRPTSIRCSWNWGWRERSTAMRWRRRCRRWWRVMPACARASGMSISAGRCRSSCRRRRRPGAASISRHWMKPDARSAWPPSWRRSAPSASIWRARRSFALR